jgi:hypothetical protein
MWVPIWRQGCGSNRVVREGLSVTWHLTKELVCGSAENRTPELWPHEKQGGSFLKEPIS